ncbi:hypothetical protein [Phenylobacterium sp.]|uniref:hypothetical protein n=1 Tax=Phenylobacterium sp. TaxID=1871053 RepID=UPI002DE4AC99|nr:hypothetical protein [Phenylobacterium sp.]
MRRATLMFCGLAVLGGAATAAPAPGTPEAAGFTQLFVSPCGEPYRGRPGEPYPVVLWFKQADANHDGVIDKAEFRADHAGFFDALDSNGDGVLDSTEVAFYENRVVPDVLGRQRVGAIAPKLILVQGQGPQGPPSEQLPGQEGVRGPTGGLGAQRLAPIEYEGAAAYGLLAEPEPVTAADTNLDFRITKAEFLAAADRRFRRLDKRGDGKLTLDELPMTAAQAAAARRKR